MHGYKRIAMDVAIVVVVALLALGGWRASVQWQRVDTLWAIAVQQAQQAQQMQAAQKGEGEKADEDAQD